jgi:hypothetical protein
MVPFGHERSNRDFVQMSSLQSIETIVSNTKNRGDASQTAAL